MKRAKQTDVHLCAFNCKLYAGITPTGQQPSEESVSHQVGLIIVSVAQLVEGGHWLLTQVCGTLLRNRQLSSVTVHIRFYLATLLSTRSLPEHQDFFFFCIDIFPPDTFQHNAKALRGTPA